MDYHPGNCFKKSFSPTLNELEKKINPKTKKTKEKYAHMKNKNIKKDHLKFLN